jgi:hypothetical protein
MHDGRYGWWWDVDGAWYFYEEPIYPYPGVTSPTLKRRTIRTS